MKWPWGRGAEVIKEEYEELPSQSKEEELDKLRNEVAWAQENMSDEEYAKWWYERVHELGAELSSLVERARGVIDLAKEGK